MGLVIVLLQPLGLLFNLVGFAFLFQYRDALFNGDSGNGKEKHRVSIGVNLVIWGFGLQFLSSINWIITRLSFWLSSIF